MNEIIFILVALAVSVMFYWIGRSNGYADGVNAGYDHGWLDGKRARRNVGRRDV